MNLNSDPNNNKQEPVKESSEKNPEPPKHDEEENKAGNDSV